RQQGPDHQSRDRPRADYRCARRPGPRLLIRQRRYPAMETTTATVERAAILVEDAHVRPMMGLEVLEPVPARNVPYEVSDPFILVHEATVPINPERAKLDTTHPH